MAEVVLLDARCDQLALAAATPLRNVLLITVDDLRPQLNKRMR